MEKPFYELFQSSSYLTTAKALFAKKCYLYLVFLEFNTNIHGLIDLGLCSYFLLNQSCFDTEKNDYYFRLYLTVNNK